MSYDNADIVRLLIDKGANINVVDENKNSILHKAIFQDKLNIVKLLLSLSLKFADTKNNDGDTPLHKASMFSFVDIMKELIKSGADVDVQNNNGLTPLMLASFGDNEFTKHISKYSKIEAAKVLLDAGADVNKDDYRGSTALSLAKEEGQKDMIELLKKEGAVE